MLPRIDIQALTIPKTILGIDINDERARIVALRRRGNPLNKSAYRFEVVKSLRVGFGENFTSQQKSDVLRFQLETARIGTRYACATVRSLGVKHVTVNVPSSVEDADEWIRENHEKLLRFPVALKEFAVSHEVLRTEQTHSVIEVTFVRNRDIEACREILERAGLQLLSLSAGTRDAVNSLLLETNRDIAFLFAEANAVSITAIREGVRSDFRVLAISNPELSNEVSVALGDLGFTENAAILSGEDVKPFNLPFTHHKPFGLDSYYALAAGLALKGFLPEVSPTNFLNEDARTVTSVSLQRSLFQRVSLTLGAILIVLLIGQMATSFFIQSKIDELEDSVLSSSSDYAEIETLQQQILAMEKKLSPGTRYHSTNFARSLHDLALATPDSVWLSHLCIEKKDGKQASIVIGGSSHRNKHVASYLKKLSNGAGCEDVNLVRSGMPEQQVFGVSERRSSAITFEITAVLNTNKE